MRKKVKLYLFPEIPTSIYPKEDPDYSAWGKEQASLSYIGFIAWLVKANNELHKRVKASADCGGGSPCGADGTSPAQEARRLGLRGRRTGEPGATGERRSVPEARARACEALASLAESERPSESEHISLYDITSEAYYIIL